MTQDLLIVERILRVQVPLGVLVSSQEGEWGFYLGPVHGTLRLFPLVVRKTLLKSGQQSICG